VLKAFLPSLQRLMPLLTRLMLRHQKKLRMMLSESSLGNHITPERLAQLQTWLSLRSLYPTIRELHHPTSNINTTKRNSTPPER
jgi:hypothetical protein